MTYMTDDKYYKHTSKMLINLIYERDTKITELEKKNLEICAQFAKLQEVAEECALAPTKVEAIKILEKFNNSFVQGEALKIRDLEQLKTFTDKMMHEVANQYDGLDSTDWSIGANHVFVLFGKWITKALKESASD